MKNRKIYTTGKLPSGDDYVFYHLIGWDLTRGLISAESIQEIPYIMITYAVKIKGEEIDYRTLMDMDIQDVMHLAEIASVQMDSGLLNKIVK